MSEFTGTLLKRLMTRSLKNRPDRFTTKVLENLLSMCSTADSILRRLISRLIIIIIIIIIIISRSTGLVGVSVRCVVPCRSTFNGYCRPSRQVALRSCRTRLL